MPSFLAASQVESTSSSFTCGKPAGVAAGHIQVAFHVADTGALSSMGTPTGGATWSPLAERAASSGAGTRIWWQVAGGSEPASYGFTRAAGGATAVSIIAVQDVVANSLVVAQSGLIDSAVTTVSTPSTTPNSSSDFEIRCAICVGVTLARTWTPPSGFVERTDLTKMTTATRALSSSAATGTHTFTVSSAVSGDLQGFTVNIGVAPISVFSGWGMPI